MPLTIDILDEFAIPNSIFVETGSYTGRGISLALRKDFKKIFSIELSEKYYQYCKNIFKNNDRVELFLGDCSELLPWIIEKIEGPITFWLDGHYSGGDTARGIYEDPLLINLDQIAHHKRKDHVLIIDDFPRDEKKRQEIKDKVSGINEKYNFFLRNYHDGRLLFEDWILIAKI